MKRLLAMLAVFLLSLQTAVAFEQITGFIPTSDNEFRADVSLEIDRTAVYTLSVDIPKNSKLVSITMSGKVIGRGKANAFAEDDNEKWYVILAYNNNGNSLSRALTGMFDSMSSTLAGDDVNALQFSNKCVETCYLEGDFNSGQVDIVFDVGEGARLKIEGITYQYEDFAETGSISFKIGKLFSSLIHLFD